MGFMEFMIVETTFIIADYSKNKLPALHLSNVSVFAASFGDFERAKAKNVLEIPTQTM
jgi:hypothetical protein